MLLFRIILVFLRIFPAFCHFPIPPLLQGETSDDSSSVNQGREHKMELEHVQFTKEMEDKILDEIDQRLADLEDIDVDAKILVRHMDRHSNFQGYESNVNSLNSIEEEVLEAYKFELNLMKRRIIASNHDLKVFEMKDMNILLDNAEVTVNNTRNMIDSFIDVHVESEEHQHEHDHEDPNDHDHDDHDSFEDYSDLLSNDTEATDDEESLIVNTIEKGLKDLDEVRNHRSQLEEHLQDHRDSQDHVNTNLADSVLKEIQVNDVEEYKESLLELKRQVGESKGNVKIDFVDKIVSTLERANIFVEVSRNRLRIADQLDDEASNDHKDDGHHHESKSSPVETTDDGEDNIDDGIEEGLTQTPESDEHDNTEPEINRNAEFNGAKEVNNGPDGVQDEVSTGKDKIPDDIAEDKVSIIQVFVDSNYYIILGCIVLFLLLVAVAAMMFRSHHHSGSESLSRSDKFHEIGGICSPQDDRSLHNYNFTTFDSPKLTSAEEFVNKTKKDEKKEDWNSRQWNQDCYKEPYKRK